METLIGLVNWVDRIFPGDPQFSFFISIGLPCILFYAVHGILTINLRNILKESYPELYRKLIWIDLGNIGFPVLNFREWIKFILVTDKTMYPRVGILCYLSILFLQIMIISLILIFMFLSYLMIV